MFFRSVYKGDVLLKGIFAMNLDDLTVKQIREIAALAQTLGGCKTPTTGDTYAQEPPVIVRAYSGVFFGYLRSKNGVCVTLRDVRHIYSWGSVGLPEKTQTCEDIAARGLGTDSKMSAASSLGIIEQVAATFFVSSEAEKILLAQKWATK